MKLVFCVDERGGMAFNKRRVSRDREMISDLAEYIGDGTILMEQYSEELFTDESLNSIISNSPALHADEDDFVFAELFDPAPFIESANEIIIYKWNRRYPYELSFNLSLEDIGFKLKETKDFKGSSHEKIKREVYIK